MGPFSSFVSFLSNPLLGCPKSGAAKCLYLSIFLSNFGKGAKRRFAEAEDAGDGTYGLLSLSEKTKKSNLMQMS